MLNSIPRFVIYRCIHLSCISSSLLFLHRSEDKRRRNALYINLHTIGSNERLMLHKFISHNLASDTQLSSNVIADDSETRREMRANDFQRFLASTTIRKIDSS